MERRCCEAARSSNIMAKNENPCISTLSIVSLCVSITVRKVSCLQCLQCWLTLPCPRLSDTICRIQTIPSSDNRQLQLSFSVGAEHQWKNPGSCCVIVKQPRKFARKQSSIWPMLQWKPQKQRKIGCAKMCQASQAPLQLADPNLGCQWALLVGANGCTLANEFWFWTTGYHRMPYSVTCHNGLSMAKYSGTMGWCLWCSNALWYSKANKNHRMCPKDVSAFLERALVCKSQEQANLPSQASANQSHATHCKTKSKFQYSIAFWLFCH